jgi:HEAT repeats
LRPVLVLVSVFASVAFADEDARVTFLLKQLSTTRDARVRAQTLLVLGQTASDAAVGPLCDAIKDSEPIVRASAAKGLGALRLPASLACLKASLGEADATVRTELEKALAMGALVAGGLYVNIEPVQDRIGGLPDHMLQLADTVMREKLLNGFKASFAPSNEEKKVASALIKARKLKAFQLRLQLLPGPTEQSLKVEMLILSYPDQSLKGSWNAKASGAKPETLIKAMVPRVLEDAAADLEWTP